MNCMERDRNYMQRIIEHCERIQAARERFGDSYDIYIQDADYRDVISMNIFQIGELANQISDDTRNENADIPWTQMYATRNIFAHSYIKVDDKIIWDTVVNDIPKLLSRMQELV